MNFKLLLLLAVIAGGGYYYYTQNPGAFGSTGTTVNGDVTRAEGKAKSFR